MRRATGVLTTLATALAALLAPAAARAAAVHPVVVARGIPDVTNVAFDARGRLWATSGEGGPAGTDGVWFVPPAGPPRHVAAHLTTALGLTWAGGSLYVGHITTPSNGRVTVLRTFDGSHFARRSVALDHLAVGEHTVDSIAAGPTGRLYVGVGSTQDHGGRAGRIVSFDPAHPVAHTEATGLRNPYGLAFHGPSLLVTDNGRDDLGPLRPPDELDRFDPAGPVPDFGFPGCYGQGGAVCAGTKPPLTRFGAHASADGLAVKGDVAYVAENGSSFPSNPTGSDVERVDLRTGRRTVLWRSPVAHDPLGAAIGPDGDLYVTLFLSRQIVRFDL